MERRLLERNKVATTVYLSVPGGKFHRCRAKNLSAMGVFLEIKALGLPSGTVVNLVFAVNLGDTLFALGCGRLFEGTPGEMWSSLQKILQWPDDTRIYCAHEYTQSNARFALTVEPQNRSLQARAASVARLRAAGVATVPSTLGEERATNPFLRPQSGDLRATIGLTGAPDVEVFAKTRALKDAF